MKIRVTIYQDRDSEITNENFSVYVFPTIKEAKEFVTKSARSNPDQYATYALVGKSPLYVR